MHPLIIATAMQLINNVIIVVKINSINHGELRCKNNLSHTYIIGLCVANMASVLVPIYSSITCFSPENLIKS